MFKAISTGLSLLIIIILLQAFLPEIANILVEIIVKLLTLANNSIDTMSELPH